MYRHRWVSRAALGALVAQLNTALHAQIHAHPSAPGAHQPTVLLAPGGVPLVNITTPSAAGVSRNIYRQFDVGTPGVVLNNSRSGATTRLGGRVAGNPWLASGPARVILNEVRSTHPSHLNGWIEVAGQRAEVIVANPAGIRVNGGGFINAGRVTLSAGLPVMHAGALEGYRVKGGQVGGYGGGQVHIDPTLRLTAHIPAGPLQTQIARLAQQPGLAHLGDLARRDDVDWQAIDLARRDWNHEQQGLTAVGAALLALAVASATGGMGADLLGSSTTTAGVSTTSLGGLTLSTTTAAGVTSTTAAGAALNAGFTGLASTAAISFVNHGGNLSAVFKDLGSSASVKQLLVGMAGAGLAQGLLDTLEFNGTALGKVTQDHGAAAFLGKQLIEHGARASANAALLGTPLEEALEGALVSSLLGTATAFGADAIGDLTVDGGLNPAGRHVLHALMGCAAGAVQAGSDGCAAGAAGGALGELAAGWFNPDGRKGHAETIAFAQLVAGLGGALLAQGGSDAASVNIAATAGGNAAEHNYLSHLRPHPLRLSEVEQYERAAAECAGGDAGACGRRDALADLSRQRDRDLHAACGGATPALCHQLGQQARLMGNAVQGTQGGFVRANSPDAGFALNVATVGAPSRPGNFHDQAANSMAQALPIAGATAGSALLSGASLGAKVMGGATLGAGFDAAGQLYQTGVVRPGQTLIAASTGAVAGPMASASVWSNALLGGAVGGVNSLYGNLMYGEDVDVFLATGIGAIFSGAGTATGQRATSMMQIFMPKYIGGTTINSKLPILLQNYGRPNPWPANIGGSMEIGIGNAPSFFTTPSLRKEQ